MQAVKLKIVFLFDELIYRGLRHLAVYDAVNSSFIFYSLR